MRKELQNVKRATPRTSPPAPLHRSLFSPDNPHLSCGPPLPLLRARNIIRLERVATAKAITLRIPQLKDCKNHFDKKKEKGKGTMVFICEGQSAAGSITNCRDVNNQAVFVLKGKPLSPRSMMRAF